MGSVKGFLLNITILECLSHVSKSRLMLHAPSKSQALHKLKFAIAINTNYRLKIIAITHDS